MHGLKLKSEALDRLDLPITVHDGYLGKFELHIPWTNLKQQPVVIEISDLYLLAGVKVQMRKDCKEEAEQLYRHKLERLETSELFVLNAGVNNSEQVSKGK